MTRREVKEIVETAFAAWENEYSTGDDWSKKHEARDIALKAIEQEPCEDAISRKSIKQKLQEHHDFFVNAYGGFSNLPQNDKSRVDEITNCIAMVVNEPPVTPQEPRWIPVSEKKPKKGGEYLLWGKIDESEEEDYCFIGDYHEFDEVFGTEISNYDPRTLGFLDTEIEEYYSVVAWMPKPKPYKAKSEDI